MADSVESEQGRVHKIDYRHIAAVDAIARTRSYQAAAETLGAEQTTLTRQVQAVEEALSVTLFRRGWSGTDLTQPGETVVRQFGLILQALVNCEAELFPDRRSHPALRVTLRRRDLEAVRATVATGTASDAATILGRTQPEISRANTQIARHLGLALFRRRSNGMEALPAALAMARLADETDVILARTHEQLRQGNVQTAGRVAIGILPFSGQSLIAQAFSRLTNRYPRIRLVAVPGSYSSLVEALRRREIDRIVGILRHDMLPADLVEIPLLTERFTVVAKASHPLRAMNTLEALSGTSWVVAPHGTPIRTYFERMIGTANQSSPIQSCEMLSFSMAEQMLVESNSLGMLSYSSVALQRLRPDLVALELALPDADVLVGVTQLRRQDHDPEVLAFDKELQDILQEMGLGLI